MQFININSARGIEINQPVFTKDDKGVYSIGRLVKEEKTAKGIERTFEIATFIEDGQPPALKPTLVTNIVAVCKIKNGEAE